MNRLWWTVLLLAACESSSKTVEPNPVKSIDVTLSAAQAVAGATVQATAVIKDAAGAILTDRRPTWTSVFPTVATVDNNGLVTTLAAGQATIRASAGGVSADVTLLIVNPRAASIRLVRDAETVFIPGGALQLLALVKDSSGVAIANPTIAWQSTQPLIASVSALGLVTPLAVGTTTVRATVDGNTASAVITVKATVAASSPIITTVGPSTTLRPGGSYTLTGSNFSATASANAVVVDGVAATVTSATTTQLGITLPTSGFACEPSRTVYVQVSTAGQLGIAPVTLQVANLRTLAVGQSVVITNAAEVRCNELALASGRYAISVYNASRQAVSSSAPGNVFVQVRGAVPAVSAATAATTASAITSTTSTVAQRATVDGATAMSGAAVAARPLTRAWDGAVPRIGGTAFDRDEEIRRLRVADVTHERLLERNADFMRANGAAIRAALARPRANTVAAATSGPTIGTLGAITPLKLPNLDATNFCVTNVPMNVRTAYVGTHAIIVEDTATVANGLPTLAGKMDADYATLGQEFDNVMWPILTANFGNPLAMDAKLSSTGKVVMVFTPKVNALLFGTVLGFVVNCDFDASQPSSNVGEFFYAVAPTSTDPGYTSRPDSRKQWLRLMRGTVLHEVKHVTAYAERLSRPNYSLEETGWEEGTARSAEEFLARTYYGTAAKQNTAYAASLGCDLQYKIAGPCADRPILMLRHLDQLYAFGAITEIASPLGRTFSGDGTFYATAWSMLRWANDHFAASEGQFFKDFTANATIGVPNFEARTGRAWEESLGEWSLALFLDDYPSFTPVNTRLKFPSWNLRNMWLGMCSDLGPCTSPTTPSQLYPSSNPWSTHAGGFGNFTTDLSLAGGSFSIFELFGNSAASQLIEVRSPAGTDPPNTIRVAIVRLP